MNKQALQEKLQRHLGYLAQDKNNLNLLLSISDCYRKLGDYPLAKQYLDEAIALSGQPFWTQLGLLYADANEIALAKEAFIHAKALEDSPTHRYNLGYCLYLNHEFEQALAVLNSPDEIQMPNPYTLLKARVLHQLRQYDDAMNLLEALVIEQESDADIAGLLALLHFDKNNMEQATLFMNQAIKLNSYQKEAQLVRILLKTLRKEVTIAEIKSLLSRTPKECRLWFALGTIEIGRLNTLAAEQAFLQAIKIWPEFYDSWICYGWCQLLKNNLDEALKAYQQSVVIDENRADGWGGIGLVYVLRNQITEALHWVKKADVIDPDGFLTSVTKIIIANQEDLQQAGKQFNSLFPDVSTDLNRLIAQTRLTLNADEKTMH